jgi:hypothetical protein
MTQQFPVMLSVTVRCCVCFAVHAFRCISNLPFPHPESLLEQLIAALPTLPSQEPQLHYTACLLLSAYAEWLGAETAVGRCLQLLPP